MKTTSLTAIMAGFLLAIAPAAFAAVPTVIPYHGRVSVEGEPFTGTGLFRFALTNEDGGQVHWKNSPVNNPVAANVIAGEFEIAVGNAAIPNMADIPFAVFDNSPLYLRVWFDDGVNGEHELLPATRLLAVPFAIMAKSVEDGAITTDKIADGAVMPGKIGTGAVGAAQIFPGAVQDYHLGNEAVTSINLSPAAVGTPALADGSVTTPKLADNAVTTAKIYPEAVGSDQIAPASVGTGHIVNGAVTDQKIANGAVTTHKIPDRSIPGIKLETGAVGTGEIANASVTAAKLAPDVLEGLTGGADLNVASVTADTFGFTEPRRFRHFIHGGEFVSARSGKDDPPINFLFMPEGEGTWRGNPPFTLTGEYSETRYFTTALRLPQGAKIHKMYLYFDVYIPEQFKPLTEDGFVRICTSEGDFTMTMHYAPLERGPEGPWTAKPEPVFSYEMPLETIVAGVLGVRVPPENHIGWGQRGDLMKVPVDIDFEKTAPIDNDQRFYALQIDWPNRLKTEWGRVWGMGNGLYGLLIEYDLAELLP